jgi:WD40 repeat protein
VLDVRRDKVIQSNESNANDAVPTVKANYESNRTVLHHHQGAITQCKFAWNDNKILCCSSVDNTLSICWLDRNPVLVIPLVGHSKTVTDFAWSISNDFILSSSLDGYLRVWNVKTGLCIREIPVGNEILCCEFAPINNNLLLAGTKDQCIHLFNLSTGKEFPKSKVNIGAAAKVICFNLDGTFMFVGDDHVIERIRYYPGLPAFVSITSICCNISETTSN